MPKTLSLHSCVYAHCRFLLSCFRATPCADPGPQSPCFTQKGWESLLDRGIRDMETLLARRETDGAMFLDGTPKQLLPDMVYLGNFKGACIYGFFASSRFFLVNAPGGPGLLDFVDTRLSQLGRKAAVVSVVLLTSCDAAETAGLKELVEKSHVQVVARSSAIAYLKESCPPGTVILAAEELPRIGWFPVTIYPLEGRGVAACAYLLSWAGKNVLFSGKIPAGPDHDSEEKLVAEISKSKDVLRGYFLSINALEKLKPDLWLPGMSENSQNANLYDSDWSRVINKNLILIKYIIDNITVL